MPKKGKKERPFEALAQEYVNNLNPNNMTVTMAPNQWNRVHGDGKSTTGGSIHSETMQSDANGPQARMLHKNQPKFQEGVKPDEDNMKAEVVTALKTGLNVSAKPLRPLTLIEVPRQVVRDSIWKLFGGAVKLASSLK